MSGFETCLEHLLSHPDIDPNKQKNDSWDRKTPILYAIQNSHNTCVEMLLNHPKTDPNFPDSDPPFIKAALNPNCVPSVFAQFMANEQVKIGVRYQDKTITKHIMEKYDEFHKQDFIREEEFRDKMMLLCKNKKYDMNADDGVLFLFFSLLFFSPYHLSL